jgi:hypothetical protein
LGYTFVYECIIRSNTCLSSSGVFTPQNSLCRKFDIGFLRDNDRIFATQLQCYRSEMFSSSSHDNLSYSSTTGEENVIKRVFEDLGHDILVPSDDTIAITIYIVREKINKYLLSVGSDFTAGWSY